MSRPTITTALLSAAIAGLAGSIAGYVLLRAFGTTGCSAAGSGDITGSVLLLGSAIAAGSTLVVAVCVRVARRRERAVARACEVAFVVAIVAGAVDWFTFLSTVQLCV